MKVVIGLLGKPMKGEKPEGGLLESDMPEALTKESVNRENKSKAVLKAMYGPSEDKMRFCGNCEYFCKDYELKENQGFCEIWEFKADQNGMCAAWEFRKEEDESEDEED